MNSPVPPPSVDASAQTSADRGAGAAGRWRAGTLVYGAGGLALLFAWLLWGDFAWQMKERAVGPVAQLMLRELKASDLIVGLLLGSVPSALGLLLGPIVSVRSDRHRGPRGRRIPYLMMPTPFVVIGMVGLAYTPEAGEALHGFLGDASPGLSVCRIAIFTLSWGIFEVATVVANSVFGGLINDVVPAALIGRFFGLFRAVSLLAGVIFNFWLIGHAEQHFRAIFLVLGALYGFGLTLMCLRVKEGEYPPPSTEPIPGFFAQVKGYFRECFTHPFYVWLFVALMLANLTGGPANSFSIFYAKSLDMDMSAYGRLLVVTYVISFALSFVLGWLADRFHPIRVGMVALGLYGVVMVWGGLTATTVDRFSVVFVIHGVLQGTYMTGTASIGQRLFPFAKFAQFSSAAGIVGAAGYILLPPITGALLDAGGHVYRHTFTASGVIAFVALASFFVVHRGFVRLAGKEGWARPRFEIPPGESAKE